MANKEVGFTYTPYDPTSAPDPELATLVDTFISKVIKDERGLSHIYSIEDVDGSNIILKKDKAWSGRILLALVHLGIHISTESQRIHDLFESKNIGPDDALEFWRAAEPAHLETRRSALSAVVDKIERRHFQVSQDELAYLLRVSVENYPRVGRPAVKCAQRMQKEGRLSDLVIEALASLREQAERELWDADGKVTAAINRLILDNQPDAHSPESVIFPPCQTQAPAMVGHHDVLIDLKMRLGLFSQSDVPESEVEVVGADRFPLRADSPLRQEHLLLCDVVGQQVQGRTLYYQTVSIDDVIGPALRDMDTTARGRLALAACERAVAAMTSSDHDDGDYDPTYWRSRQNAMSLPSQMAAMEMDLDRAGWFDLFLLASVTDRHEFQLAGPGYDVMERLVSEHPPSAGELYVMHRLRAQLIDCPPMGACPPLVSRVCKMMGEPDGYLLVPGEYWSDRIHSDLGKMSAETLLQWQGLFQHAASASSSKPSAKWVKAGIGYVNDVGSDAFIRHLSEWLPEVAKGRSLRGISQHQYDTRSAADTFNEGNATVLRGLVWMLTAHASEAVPRLMGDLLLTSVKKVPGIGPRAVKVANACVWALGELAAADDEKIRDGALGQLARLKAKVTFRTTLKAIEKALDKAAEAAGVSRDEIEELGTPAFGFEDGVLREMFGDAVGELHVDGNKVLARWINEKGKAVKSPPAAVKRDFKEQLKDFKQFGKDAEGVLLAGRERLDTLFLSGKTWPLSDWRERYLDHGLLCTLVRRLIWLIDDVPVMFDGDRATDVHGEAVTLTDSSSVRLWHPVEREQDEVLAWRERVEGRQITQPFKQAHREVYLLTDAEMNTGVYSNRYAAHVIKQHQFNALCGARRWRNSLRLMVDDEYPPASLELPAWNLRAEFWVEGIGDNYGTDTTESGTYLYLATDQVRFYSLGSAENTAHAGGGGYTWGRWHGETEPEPVPLDQIPPLVLSEVMRDVDLFVGVASVGNDPTWQDGGPDGRHVDYWQSYSFGDLSGTAKTRKDLLERLIPRLKIAEQCSLDDRFLVVKGSVRTYKIHLGSGNILMEPNDQYLCIVPGGGAVKGPAGKVFLPFEGDRTLSIILSKAFLLADDQSITDSTILSQIRSRT